MERNLFRYIWGHSRREQSAILLLVMISLPFYFFSLNIPKSIVNEGIQGQGFDDPGSTQPFMRFELPFSEGADGQAFEIFGGFALEQTDMLVALSVAFLALVMINGLFKFAINTQKGRMGERMLRRLRFELGDRILRFPLLHMRRVKQSEMATMIKDEVEPLGGFIGDAFVTPVFLGGQALTALVFILVQSIWLGSIALAIVLVQAFIIPKLRQRILQLGRQRQITARQLAGRIGELVDGAVEIQAHDTSNYERADLAERLGRIFYIRYEIFQRKFFVKFLNNLLSQFTPFVFYLGGGLLAIYGYLDIGALVAVIAAYKDLPGPIKELIDWEQNRADVQIKYDQVIEQFQPSAMIDPVKQALVADDGPALSGDLVASAVSLLDDNDFRLLEGISFTVPLDQQLAIVGPSGSGKEHVAMILAGLTQASGGTVKIGGRDVETLPSAVTGRRMSFVGQDCYHFPRTVRDNMLYGLVHRPLRAADYQGPAAAKRARDISEAKLSGNPDFDFQADWVDYAAAGVSDPAQMTERLIEILSLVEFQNDVYRFGLTGTLDPHAKPAAAAAILAAREGLVERLARDGLSDLVVRFSTDHYNASATLAENLLFGTPVKPDYVDSALGDNALLNQVLDELELREPLLNMGQSIAKTMVEIFADLPAGHPFFEQFSFIIEDDLPDYKTLMARLETAGLETITPDDRRKLLGLSFPYIEQRHRLGLVDDEMQERIVRARHRFAEILAEQDPKGVEVYRDDIYNAASALQDNILFGRIAHGRAQAQETVERVITEVLDDLGLRTTVIEIGLDYQVGVGGKRLSSIQRQKLGLARALLKEPDLLVVNEAVAVMDGATQGRLLDNILKYRAGRGVIWTLQRASMAERFQRVVVLEGGRVVEQGDITDLNRPGSAFRALIAAAE